MSFIRVFSTRQLRIKPTDISRLSISPSKYYVRPRTFTSTHARGLDNPPQLSESVVNAVRGTKAWDALEQNLELQQVFLETLQVLKDEGVDPAKPSVMVLFKSSKLREQLKKMTAAMQISGIDMESFKELQQAVVKAMEEEAKKK